QNSVVHHPYYFQPYCSCCPPSGSQMMSPPSPSSTSFQNRTFPYQQVTFEPLELSEETIMDKTHNETLAKLNFVLALVDSIFEFINNISNPIAALSDSFVSEVSGACS